jgi:hypothetical protein
MAMQAPTGLIFTTHSWVSFKPILQISMPNKLNSLLPRFFYIHMRDFDLVLGFLYCGVGKPYFGDLGHIQGKAHVRLFELHPISLPCHGSKHVETLLEIIFCFKECDSDSAITITIYILVSFSSVFAPCFINSR